MTQHILSDKHMVIKKDIMPRYCGMEHARWRFGFLRNTPSYSTQ